MTSEAPEHGWLIHKAGRGWYRPDAKGYTMNQDEAGRYSHKDALAYSHPNGLDGPRDGLTIKHESELPPSPADLHRQALDAAREEGRKQGLKEAAEWHDLEVTHYGSACGQKDGVDFALVAWWHQQHAEAIRTLLDKPADPVAEADSFDALICDAKEEAERAMQKFPQPNYVISKVAEEAGEVVKAAIHCAEGREEASEVRGEMKQLVAMLYRLWVEGDGVHGLRALAQKEGE